MKKLSTDTLDALLQLGPIAVDGQDDEFHRLLNLLPDTTYNSLRRNSFIFVTADSQERYGFLTERGVHLYQVLRRLEKTPS